MNESTSPATAGTPDRDTALCRSVLYEALALGFRAPTRATCTRLGTPRGAAALALAAEVIDPAMGASARDLANCTDGRSLDRLEESYRRLFGHTARGLVTAYETEYGADTLFQKPQEISDIAGFLHVFGLDLAPGAHERLDHVACELEFLAILARKEAHAVESLDDEMLRETRRAIRMFLRDHLARFAPSLSRRVMRHDPDGFYGRLAALCIDFVRSECSRLGVPAGPETLRLRLPIDDHAPMACGGPDGCAPGPCGPQAGESIE